jgi:hypothetical protein
LRGDGRGQKQFSWHEGESGSFSGVTGFLRKRRKKARQSMLTGFLEGFEDGDH